MGWKDPNRQSNRFKPEVTVKSLKELLKVRQEHYMKLKSKGVGDHPALVQAINFVAIADTSKSSSKRSRRKK
jgi:hypothetical protein